uniref:Uncharacterized protein n=1 Tax=Helicotheca tamesis TaxID=374047 RepID=A0A7S2I1C9_9STRA
MAHMKPQDDTIYNPKYLESLSSSDLNTSPSDSRLKYVQSIISSIDNLVSRGFCIELFNYISDVTSNNPKRGFGTSRTALWGVQRPPILDDMRTAIRCNSTISFSDLVPIFLPFYVTNAREQVELSIDPENEELLKALQKLGVDDAVKFIVEDASDFEDKIRSNASNYYNVVEVKDQFQQFPLVGQFMSLYFPLGHIKSTMSNDDEFVSFFEKSEKWLKLWQGAE